MPRRRSARRSPRPGSEVVLDTSAWFAIFNDEPEVEAILAATRDLRSVTTSLVLAELQVHADLGRVRKGDPVGDVERRSRLEPLTREDGLAGARTYARLRREGRAKVSLADVLIHATALRIGAPLVTLDRDLLPLSGVLDLGLG
jgi:predicted nucleic acid-binding protein